MKTAPRIKSFFLILAMVVNAMPTFGAGKTNRGLDRPPSVTADDDCDKWCSLPKGKERLSASVVIDANTGQILEGGTRFAEGEKVQVIFVNKNPFKYSYRFQVLSQPLETAIILGFLNLIPGFGGTLTAALGGGAPPGLRAPQCTEGQAILTEARGLQQQSQELATQLNILTEDAKSYQEKHTAFIKATEVDKIIGVGTTEEILNCKTLCNQAKTLVNELSSLDLKLKAARKAVDTLQSNITDLETRANALTGACKDDTVNALTPLTDPRKEDLKKYNKRLEDLAKAKESFDSLANIIKVVFASERPFVEIMYPPTSGGPTSISISIFRKNLRNPDAKEQEIAKITLQVGESRIALSGGIGFTTIQDKRIIRQPFTKSDGTLGARFGEENKSGFRPSGVVMLNASLCHIGDCPKCSGGITFGPSTGLVLSSRNDTVEAEFIGGVFFGFLKNTVFLNFGYHAARVERLGGGFTVAQEIPANVQDPLPVEKNWKGGFMFAITYKIR